MKSLNWKEYSDGMLCKVHGMKKLPDIIYYDDPLRDEFSTAEITPRRIDDAYRYVYTGRWKQFTHFFWYRVVATPLAWIYLKFKFSHRIVNRAVLDQHRAEGYFLYGNHTQAIADALIPTMVSAPKNVYVIVHPNNVSMPVLGRITPSLGALPLPDTLGASRHFLAAVAQRVEEHHVLCIYPEAHIWPYYTGIRPFTDQSFHYPVRYNKPVYCFTNTYQQRKPGGKVRMVTYVDGPFYPDRTLKPREQQAKLRDAVFNAMTARATNSNAVVVRYLPRAEEKKETPPPTGKDPCES